MGIEGKDVYLVTEGRVVAVVSGMAGSKIRPEILFAGCRAPQMMVILSATDGKRML